MTTPTPTELSDTERLEITFLNQQLADDSDDGGELPQRQIGSEPLQH